MSLKKLPLVMLTLLGASAAYGLEQNGLSGNGETGAFLNLDTSYDIDDNPFLIESNAVDDEILKLAPSISFIGKSGMNTYSVRYDGEFGRYSDFDAADYDDHTVGGAIDLDINDSSNLNLDASFGQLHDDVGTGGSEGSPTVSGQPDEYDLLTYGGEFELGADSSAFQGQVRANMFDKEYTNNKSNTFDRDHEMSTLGGTLFFNLSPDAALLFEANYDDIEYDAVPTSNVSLDSEETTIYVGFQWAIGAKTTGYVKVGQQDKEFSDSRRKDEDSVAWDVAVSWAPRTYSTFSLGTSKGFNETNGFGNSVLSQAIDLSWNHNWGDKLTTNVSYSYIEDEMASTFREDETNRFDLNAVYELRRWIDLEFNASFIDRDSNATLISYDREIYTISVNVGV
jgi:hypothetical protein